MPLKDSFLLQINRIEWMGKYVWSWPVVALVKWSALSPSIRYDVLGLNPVKVYTANFLIA